MATEKIKTKILYRAGTLQARAVAEGEEDKRIVDLTFSSEAEVDQWFGTEILGHDAGEIKLDRLKTGSAPLLVGHNSDDQIGVIESVSLGSDRRGHAVARFGKSARAEEIYQDVKDGIRTAISCGYRIHEMKLVSSTAGKKAKDVYRAVKWEPFEISIVSVPADTSVGIGRSADTPEFDTLIIKEENSMSQENDTKDDNKVPANVRQMTKLDIEALAGEAAKKGANEALDAERKRMAEITEIAVRFNRRDLGDRAIKDGLTIEQFRGVMVTNLPDGQDLDTPPTDLDLGKRDLEDYSLHKAIRAALDKNWSQAGLEQECSREIADRLGREAEGFFMPYDVLAARSYESMKRTQTVGSDAGGGYLVGTDHLGGEFIGLLRNKTALGMLGARFLTGLRGDVAIPKQISAATAYWISAEGGNTTASDMAFGTLALTPKTVSGRVNMTRKLLMQSDPSVEALTFDDLTMGLALAMDLAGIAGTGADGQPTGILNTTGIGDVAGGTNGAAPTYDHMVDLESDVAIANADIGNIAYLSNAKVRGVLKKTLEFTGVSGKVWANGPNGEGVVNGHRAIASNQVPSDLTKGSAVGICSAIIFGNFRDVIFGNWGILDISPDAITLADSGGLVVRAFQDIDVGLRRPASISAMQDGLAA